MKKIIYIVFISILFITNLNYIEADNGDYYYSSEHDISFLVSENKAILLTPHDKGGVFGDSQNAMASWNISGDGDTLCYISNSMGTNSVSYSTNCSGITLKKTDISNNLKCSYNIINENANVNRNIALDIYNFNNEYLIMYDKDFSTINNDGNYSFTEESLSQYNVSFNYKLSSELNNLFASSCPDLGYQNNFSGAYAVNIIVGLYDENHKLLIENLSDTNDPGDDIPYEDKRFTNNLQSNDLDLYKFEVITLQENNDTKICLQPYYLEDKKYTEQCFSKSEVDNSTTKISKEWILSDENGKNISIDVSLDNTIFDLIVNDTDAKIYVNWTHQNLDTTNSVSQIFFELSDVFKENNMYTDPTDKDFIETLTGKRFEEYMSKLKKPLGFTSFNYTGNSGLLGELDYNSLELGLTEEQLCLDDSNDAAYCGENINYYIERGVKDVVDYCNVDVFAKYASTADKTYIDKRLKECTDFITVFYPEMVEKGVINSIESDCGFISQDLLDILQTFLNIIAIAAPILAVGLGVLDFIKVIASGDADKEMKNAGKNFLTRVGVAMILLITPLLIAYLLDIFAPIIPGLETDNPFCDIVEIE